MSTIFTTDFFPDQKLNLKKKKEKILENIWMLTNATACVRQISQH